MTIPVPMPCGYSAVVDLDGDGDGDEVRIEVLDAEGIVRRRVRGPWNAARLRATGDSELFYIVDRAIERGARRPA
jgi:hypothetical protein